MNNQSYISRFTALFAAVSILLLPVTTLRAGDSEGPDEIDTQAPDISCTYNSELYQAIESTSLTMFTNATTGFAESTVAHSGSFQASGNNVVQWGGEAGYHWTAYQSNYYINGEIDANECYFTSALYTSHYGITYGNAYTVSWSGNSSDEEYRTLTYSW